MNASAWFDPVAFDPQFCVRVCLVLVHSLWQIALLAVVAGFIRRFLKRDNPEQGYAVYTIAMLLGLAALPITYAFVDAPENNVTVPREVSLLTPDPAKVLPTNESLEIMTAELPLPVIGEHQSLAASVSRSAVSRTWWLDLARWLVGVYAAGVLVMALRLVRGIWKSHQLATTATPITVGSLHQALHKLARTWSLRLVPTLAEARGIVVPQVVGFMRPTILLPTSAITGLTPEELEMILAHELAHVRRYDMWVSLVQRIAETVLFFNPVLWYLSRRVSTYREYCCDEQTCRLASREPATARLRYAQALLHVVELSNKTFPRAEITALAAAGNRPSELRSRVARLFGEPLREPVRMSRPGLLALVVGLILLVVGPMSWQNAAETEKPVDISGEFNFGESKRGKIEILGIGTYDQEPRRWWNASGEALDEVPFKVQGASVTGEARQLVFRIANLPKDADVTWDLTGCGGYARGEVVLDGEESPFGYFSNVFAVKKDSPSIKLRVGVAAGEWKTVTTVEGIGSQSIGLLGGMSVAFAGAFAEEDRFSKANQSTVVVVSHNFKGKNVRVIAVDKSGKRHDSSGSASQGVGDGVIQTKYSFRNVLPDQIEHFEFQTRDYEWAEINELPVEPAESQAAVPVDAVADPQVEVAAIGTHYEEPQIWWDAEGRVLKEVPFIWQDANNVSSQEKVWRRIVYRITALPKDAEVVWNVLGGGSWGDATATPLEAEKNRAYFARYVGLRERSETLGLRVGIASGPWVTSVKGTGLQANGIMGTGIIFSGAFAKDDGCVVVVSHNLSDVNVRVIAIDQTGKQHLPQGLHQVSAAGGLNQLHWSFKDLSPNDIDHFEFQTRLYKWTEINDLPVEPGEKIAAVVKENIGLPQEDSLSPLQTEYFIKLRSLTNHNRTAFAFGPLMIAKLSPEEALGVTRTVWPEIKVDEVKTGLLKTFVFARHSKVLDVLDLGATDKSEFVRGYAYSYLQNYALRDFKQPQFSYKAWREQYVGKSTEEVLADNCQWFVESLRSDPPMAELAVWEKIPRMLDLSGSKSSYPVKAEYLRRSGLRDLIKTWLADAELDAQLRQSFEQFLTEMDSTFDETQPYRRAELSGRNLKGLFLQGNVDYLFSNADLSKVNLSDATIVGGRKAFSETVFAGANFARATLIGRAGFQKANFVEAVLQDANLNGETAGFQVAKFDGSDLKNARLTGGGGAFQEATFQNANLQGARLQGDGSAFQKANFDNADLTGATVLCDGLTAFQVVNLNNTNFSSADLSTINADSLASCTFGRTAPPLYDAATKFPTGFDPADHGWQLIE